MLSREDNDLQTKTGGGTPTGVVARFPLPPLLAGVLPPGGGWPVPARLGGEDLGAFRDADGSGGTMSACRPHRDPPLHTARPMVAYPAAEKAGGIPGEPLRVKGERSSDGGLAGIARRRPAEVIDKSAPQAEVEDAAAMRVPPTADVEVPLGRA
jgi:hypothetical protein